MKQKGLLQVLDDHKQLQEGFPGYPSLTCHVQLVAAMTFHTHLPTFALWTGLAVCCDVWADEGCQAVPQN